MVVNTRALSTRGIFLVSLLLLLLLLGSLGCDKKDSSATSDSPEVPAPAPVGLTGAVLAVDGQPTGLRLETAGVATTLSGTHWSFGPGSTLKTDSATRAALTIGEGASVVLERDSVIRFPSDKARGIVLEQGRAVFEFPHRDAASTQSGPSAHITVPTGEVLLLGTKVSIEAFAGESTITVSQGVVEARGQAQGPNEILRGYAGDQIILSKDQIPRILGTPDLAESFGWSDLATDAESELAEVPRGIGKLVGKVPGGYKESALEKRNQKVTVRIQGNVAYTEVHEVFYNPTSETLEGLYRFPMPSDAQISRLSLKVGSRWMEGEFLETERAARIWRDVIERWRDPAWLRWQQGNQFELRIFPIDARTSREVIIGYTQRLEPSGDGYRYVYPMPLDKGAEVASKRFDFDATLVGIESTQGVATHGYGAGVEYGADQNDAALARVRFGVDDFVPSGDFSIRFARQELQDKARVYAYEQTGREGRGSYALVTLRPTLPRAEQRVARDFVVVLDSSYSQRGAAFDLSRRVVSRLIKEMDPADRVLVVACNERCQPVGAPVFEDHSPVAEAAVADALAALTPRGSNHVVEALRVAAAILDGRGAEERVRSGHIIYFTDGIASAGALSPDELSEAAGRLLGTISDRLTLVDVGGDADAANLQALARGGRGSIVRLTPGETMAAQALQILSRHYGALLTELAVDLPRGMELVHPRHFEALMSGQEIVVAAKVGGPIKGDIRLHGRLGGDRFERSYPIDLKPAGQRANAFVPRQWAQLRIRDLELDDATASRKEIIDLSVKYGVLSRFTSLLAMESDEMMREYGVRKHDRSDWRGDEMPEEQAAAAADEPEAAPIAAPAQPTRSSRASTTKTPGRSSNDKKFMTPAEYDGGDLADLLRAEAAAPRTTRPAPGRRYQPRETPASAPIRPARPTTDWERGYIKRFADRLARDENNRTTRLSYIRSFVRAGQIDEAEAEVDRWLETNPVDGEAIVQKAQILSYRGQVREALELLAGAVDVAARGEWIQTRIQAAYKAIGDEALACAHAQSLESINSKKRVAEPLACPMATQLGQWGLSNPRTPSLGRTRAPFAPLRGNLVVSVRATTDDDAEFTLLIIEPDGRILSWLSQRRRLQVAGVHSEATQQIALPTLYQGTFKIRVVRMDGGTNPAPATLTVRSLNRTQTFDVMVPPGTGEAVAEIVYTPARRGHRGRPTPF